MQLLLMGFTDKTIMSIYSWELEKNYYKYHWYCYHLNKITDGILSVICYSYLWIYRQNKTSIIFLACFIRL